MARQVADVAVIVPAWFLYWQTRPDYYLGLKWVKLEVVELRVYVELRQCIHIKKQHVESIQTELHEEHIQILLPKMDSSKTMVVN